MKLRYLTPQHELDLLRTGEYSYIIGIDEVGRGCWAGPVAVGAYVFSLNLKSVRGVHDSKKLTPKQREKVYSKLNKHTYCVKFASVREIDSLGIGKTVEKLIREVVKEYYSKECLFLIDGQFSRDFGSNTSKIIDGDAKYYSIAAGSILAKVERDSLMRELDLEYPDYSFAKHKGYGTREHRDLIAKYGICELHRKSYEPIKKYL